MKRYKINPTLLQLEKSSFMNMLCGSHRESTAERLAASQYKHSRWLHKTKRMQGCRLTTDSQHWQNQWINSFLSAYFYTGRKQGASSNPVWHSCVNTYYDNTYLINYCSLLHIVQLLLSGSTVVATQYQSKQKNIVTQW